MAASGSPFPSPRACPFVALELDRDRRSEQPDYRHRCFAEPAPAPRSIAHQESFCLSPNFSGCPIFQDWAVRAAAAPVGGRVTPPVGQTTAAATSIGAAGGTAALHESAADEPDVEPPAEPAALAAVGAAAVSSDEPPIGEPPLVESPPLERETVRAPERSAWEDVSDPEQLSVFGGGGGAPAHAGATDADEPHSSFGQPDAGYPEPPDLSLPETPPDYVAPPPRPEPAQRAPVEEAAVPAFLAGRATRPAGAASPPEAPRPPERITRDEVVPSWDIDGRYGAVRAEEPRGGGSRLDNILTAIAVIAILLLGVAGVIFLPGLLAGSPTRSPAASFVPASARPTVAATAAASATPTVAPRTATPSAAPSVSAGPIGSPRYYRIKAGDSLASIAARFRISVDELLAANPDIVDPNYIQVGQRIVIPPASEP